MLFHRSDAAVQDLPDPDPAMQLNKPASAPGGSDGATQFLTPPNTALQLNKPVPQPVGSHRPSDPAMRNSRNPSSRNTGLLSSLSKLCIDLPLRRIARGGEIPACSSPTIYGPDEVGDNFHRFKNKDMVQRVLAKIEMIYKEVNLDNGSLESGCCFCLGLLSPQANIRINYSIFLSSDYSLPAAGNKGVNNMAQRSLAGLITFLTCLFPYLPDAEALAYLDFVDADPLAAAVLISDRRGKKFSMFNYLMDDPPAPIDEEEEATAATIVMALRCAAIAAGHPEPLLLVKGWTNVSHCPHEVANPLSGSCPAGFNTLTCLYRNLRNEHCNLKVRDVWELAEKRLHAKQFWVSSVDLFTGRLPPVRAAMKRTLLGKIHGFYQKVLCSLPKDELTERYHRALIMGGYCYGPLQPAANIIANMIWFEQTFPTTKGFKTTMISTRLLWRVVARSLYGLISFLCARYPSLTPDHAMQRLLVAEANLQVADPNLFDTPSSSNLKMNWSGCPKIGSGIDDTVQMQMKAVRKASASVLEAYAAAATAAHHPSPHAQKEFLGLPVSVEGLKNASGVFHLDDGHQLSNIEFDVLCMHLRRCISSVVGISHQQQEPETTTEASKSGYGKASGCVQRFWSLHDQVTRMVSAALEKFNRTDKSQYGLHVICCVNECVSGPNLCSSHMDRGFSPSFPYNYQYSHINFLATRLDNKLHGQPTKLFFAECNLDDYDGDDTWCLPVDWSNPLGQARCFYCETYGNRIVHPALAVFHGSDFGEAFFGPHKMFYDNNHIIFLEHSDVDWVDYVEDQDIYENYQVCDDDDAVEGAVSKRLRPELY